VADLPRVDINGRLVTRDPAPSFFDWLALSERSESKGLALSERSESKGWT
jgi:hypothetical protein